VVKDDSAGLERTARSLDLPGRDGIEWVIVDGSTDADSTRGITERAAPSGVDMRYAWSAPAGVYAAMNTALEMCSGRYVWFINAGDEVQGAQTLTGLRKTLDVDPLWVIGQVAFVDARGHVAVPPPFDYEHERKHHFARGRFAPHQGTIVRTQWARETGGFATGYRIAADYEMSLRLSRAGAPIVVPDVIARFHTGGLSTQQWASAVSEFHRARCNVLDLHGLDAAREAALTGSDYLRGALGAGLRRVRGSR
jgi:hypothetical protein